MSSSFFLYVCVLVPPFLCLCPCLFAYMFVPLSFRLYVCVLVSSLICLCPCLFAYMFVSLSLLLYVCVLVSSLICMCPCLFSYMYVSLSFFSVVPIIVSFVYLHNFQCNVVYVHSSQPHKGLHAFETFFMAISTTLFIQSNSHTQHTN